MPQKFLGVFVFAQLYEDSSQQVILWGNFERFAPLPYIRMIDVNLSLCFGGGV